MGFDNESIINIQSLPGEYFCPVCRQLVYPNEALQTQCTHLYCKPCLTYVVSTTRACPYDGYLVTDTDSKPLQESNSTLAETIGRVVVHCLYHKSGCTWQGPLSESIGHGNSCPYGSSPVVCNRCGTQIVHRQVQEHAQNCPGTQAQAQAQAPAPAQQQENAQQAQGAAVAAGQYDQNQVAQAGAQQYPSQTAVQATQAAASQPTQYGMGQDPALSVAVQQGATQASANDQWYQQQYQQYYQQYPQYDQYQQYQQYDQYQQQVQAQLQQQAQAQAQPHPQVQHPQAQAQAQPHTQVQHPQAQAQPHTQLQHPQAQAQPQAQGQPQHHHQAQAQPLVQAAHASQPYQQVQGQTMPPPQQQVQPQQQVIQTQPHQMMPNQSQVPVQQQPLPMQSQQQPVQQPQQHSLLMQQQFPPSQQPQMHQQHPPSQQPTHMQQHLPAIVGQQLPQQQPSLQHHPQAQHHQIMQQPPTQQQLMLQQQIPSQLQQPTQGPMQHPQPFPPQQQQMPHQPQQQAPFHPPQSVHAPQYIQSQIQPGSQHHPQLQPPFQQGQPPSQPFSQPYPQNAGQVNASQQTGNRPPMTQNQGFVQQSLPQARPHQAPYSQPIRAPNKALQAAPNQTYMPRPAQRAHVPHQRPPIHQSSVPRSTNQTTFIPGSTPSQSVRTNAQTAAAPGVSKVAPAVEKIQEGLQQENITKIQLMQNEKSVHPTKPAQSNEANNAPAQNNDLETVKTESIKSENKSNDNEQRLANEVVEEKTLPISEASKNEGSDSSQQQISMKIFQVVKHETDSQQLVAQKKAHEDGSQKPEEVGADKSSQEPNVHLQELIEEISHSHQDGSIQQYPHEVRESDFLHNATRQAQETRVGSDEKNQKITRPLGESKQWQEGNTLQQSSQGQDRNSQQPLRQGPAQGLDKSSSQNSRHGPVQLQDRNFQHASRHGAVQGQDRNLPGPPRQGPIHGQERNALHPSRQGSNQVNNRGLQQPLRGPAPGQDRNSQLPMQQGSMQGQDRPLQQPFQHERDMQQLSVQSQIQGHEKFQQPPRQGPLQGQQFPYAGQSQSHERNIQQLPYPVQTHSIPEQFQHSKQGGMPPMSLLPQHQPGSSSMPSFGRGGHGQAQSQQFFFDMASPSNLHPPQMASRSQLGESMLGLPSSLPPSMSHHLGAYEGPRGLMDMGMQFGPSSQQSPLSKSVEHKDIMGNKRPEVFGNRQNELQQSTGSRFLMNPPSGFQPNIMKPNGGTSKGHIEGMQSSLFPPIMGDEGSFRSMHQDQGRHTSDRREYQESSRKYKPGQFDVQLSSNPDEMLPSLCNQKGQVGSMSKFDQIPPMTRPLEAGPHGFLPDSISNYPLTKTASPGDPSSRLFPPYQSTASFPPSSGGPSMFSSDIVDGPRLPGIHEDMMARRSESAGIRPDFMGPRSEFGRIRHDSLAPPRSPGKDFMGLTSGRPNVGPSGGFGPGFGGPSHLSRPIEDLNRDPLSFEEQRNKPFGFHSAAMMHNVFQPGQLPLDVGNRFAPFHSGPATGAPGPLPNHMMMGDPGPGFGPNIPMQAFPGENALFNKQGQMLSDFESSELGRKRKPGSMGWCRICQIDCYTVEGLEQHTLTREHQKMAMDMVLSIKQDNAKRQKLSSEDPTTQENGNKPKRTGFEGRGSRR